MPVPPPPPPWHSPVVPVVVERAYRVVAPFLPGGHRAADLRARTGSPVRAPCDGRVTFRGRVAGGPAAITIDCGDLRATLRWVAASVPRGALVGRGEPIGVAAAARIGLSARDLAGRYRDPAPLLGAPGSPPGGPSPVGARPTGWRRGHSWPTDRPGTQLAAPDLRPRPDLPGRPPQAPARLADRALVNQQAELAFRVASSATTRVSPVDGPLTVIGVGVVGAALVGLGGQRIRRLRRRRAAAGTWRDRVVGARQ